MHFNMKNIPLYNAKAKETLILENIQIDKQDNS